MDGRSFDLPERPKHASPASPAVLPSARTKAKTDDTAAMNTKATNTTKSPIDPVEQALSFDYAAIGHTVDMWLLEFEALITTGTLVDAILEFMKSYDRQIAGLVDSKDHCGMDDDEIQREFSVFLQAGDLLVGLEKLEDGHSQRLKDLVERIKDLVERTKDQAKDQVGGHE